VRKIKNQFLSRKVWIGKILNHKWRNNPRIFLHIEIYWNARSYNCNERIKREGIQKYIFHQNLKLVFRTYFVHKMKSIVLLNGCALEFVSCIVSKNNLSENGFQNTLDLLSKDFRISIHVFAFKSLYNTAFKDLAHKKLFMVVYFCQKIIMLWTQKYQSKRYQTSELTNFVSYSNNFRKLFIQQCIKKNREKSFPKMLSYPFMFSVVGVCNAIPIPFL